MNLMKKFYYLVVLLMTHMENAKVKVNKKMEKENDKRLCQQEEEEGLGEQPET